MVVTQFTTDTIMAAMPAICFPTRSSLLPWNGRNVFVGKEKIASFTSTSGQLMALRTVFLTTVNSTYVSPVIYSWSTRVYVPGVAIKTL